MLSGVRGQNVNLGLAEGLFLNDLTLTGILRDTYRGTGSHNPLSKQRSRLVLWGDGFSAEEGKSDGLLNIHENLMKQVGTRLLWILIILDRGEIFYLLL
jgi:hypothetical protein